MERTYGMTERQAIIAHKITVQAAKNKLKRIPGIAVLELYGENENLALNECASRYFSISCGYDQKPYSRLFYKSPEETVCSWMIDTMNLKEHRAYYYFCGIWSKIELLDLTCAVSFLWREDHGFLFAEADLSRMLECGFDSRDENHFLIDIWENRKSFNP
jgi:hypothetical protein